MSGVKRKLMHFSNDVKYTPYAKHRITANRKHYGYACIYLCIHVTVIALDIHMYACVINHTITSLFTVTCYTLINFVSVNI